MSRANKLKNYFLRGLAVLLPILLTAWILAWFFRFIHHNVTIYIAHGLVKLIVLQAQWRGFSTAAQEGIKAAYSHLLVEGAAGAIVSFVLAVVIVCLVGALLASVLGRIIWRLIEQGIVNTPVLRRVYPYVKQVTDFLLTQDEQAKLFSRVVAVEYPRQGIWSIGYVTGSGIRRVAESVRKEFLTVLIPSTPTPITGFVILVPKEQTIALDMTIEEAFRFVMSAGVVAPGSNGTAALPKPNSEHGPP